MILRVCESLSFSRTWSDLVGFGMRSDYEIIFYCQNKVKKLSVIVEDVNRCWKIWAIFGRYDLFSLRGRTRYKSYVENKKAMFDFIICVSNT